MTTQTDQIIYSDFPIDLTGFFPSISPGFVWEWGWSEEDDNDILRDTTGWTSEMDLRETPNGPLIAKLSTANGKIVNDNNGTFAVSMPAVDSLVISAKKLITNVKVTDDNGIENNHFKGSIDVEEIVTK